MVIPEGLLINGLLALLIIKEVLAVVISFLKKKAEGDSNQQVLDAIGRLDSKIKENFNTQAESTKETQKKLFDPRDHNKLLKIVEQINVQMNDLYRWHNKQDADGVFVWYVRTSLVKAVNELSDSIKAQTEVLKQITADNRAITKDYQALIDQIRESRRQIETSKIDLTKLLKENFRQKD